MNQEYNSLVNEALSGNRGRDQQLIAEEGLKWITTLLKKNKDYGSSVFNTPILAPETGCDAAIRVRMSDKVNRLNNLLISEAEVDESISDTMTDLGAYCLLWLVGKRIESMETVDRIKEKLTTVPTLSDGTQAQRDTKECVARYHR